MEIQFCIHALNYVLLYLIPDSRKSAWTLAVINIEAFTTDIKGLMFVKQMPIVP